MSIKNKHSCNLKLALLFFVHTKSCFANNYSLELNVWLEEVKKKHPIIKAIQHLAICHSLPNMYIVPSVDELCHFSYSLLQWRREILFLLIWAHNHKTNSLPLLSFRFSFVYCILTRMHLWAHVEAQHMRLSPSIVRLSIRRTVQIGAGAASGLRKEVVNYLSGVDLSRCLEAPLTAALWNAVGVGAARGTFGEWVTAHHECVVQWEFLNDMILLGSHRGLWFDLECWLRGSGFVVLG